MVQRSKRSMSPAKAGEMNAAVREFHYQVRKWAADTPIGSSVYIALDPLNSALDLMGRVLNAEMDSRGFERRYGEGGME
jgi:hypothetical protein